MNPIEVIKESWGWAVRQSYFDGGHSQWPMKSEAEARAYFDEIMANPQCRECGDHQVFRFASEQKATEMRERQLCLTCNGWEDTRQALTDHHAVIDGCLYEIGEDERSIARRCRWPLEDGQLACDYRHVLGHGGGRFEIAFNDGRNVVTTNLWARGEIPMHFRDRLPDTARFASREQSAAYVGAGRASF